MNLFTALVLPLSTLIADEVFTKSTYSYIYIYIYIYKILSEVSEQSLSRYVDKTRDGLG